MSGLGDELNRAAGTPEPSLDLEALAARARRRTRTKRRALASGACAVVLLAGGVAWGASQGDGSTQQVSAGEGGVDGESITTAPVETTVSVPTTPTIAVETTTTVPEVPATTTATTTTPAPPTTTAVPAASDRIEVRGTYTGEETYRPDTTECGGRGMDIAHSLMAVLTPSSVVGGEGIVPGGDWRMKADYCSRIQGEVWSASGQVGIGVGQTSTLEGIFTSETAYPTDGEPYEITIESGSGTLAGARGTCDLTVRITDKAFGRQTQSGEFHCVLDLEAAGAATMGGGSTDPQPADA